MAAHLKQQFNVYSYTDRAPIVAIYVEIYEAWTARTTQLRQLDFKRFFLLWRSMEQSRLQVG
jgi:hypothetical protein